MALEVMGQEATEQNETEQQEEWLLIGRIVGAHGLNGHVKVHPESDFPERFTVPGDRWLKKPNGDLVQIKITSGRFLEGKKQYLVKLEDVNFRDQAEDLRKAELLVKESDRLSLDPGEFHVSDLIGLTVVLQSDDSVVGLVRDVYTTGHDMLEVELANQERLGAEPTSESKQEETAQPHPSTRAKAAQRMKKKARKGKKKAAKTLLIPFVEEIVPVVDLSAKRIELTPPPGLIDL